MKVIKCIVIDDDADDREIFELAVSACGIDISCVFAKNGSEGLSYLRNSENITDIIFLDMNMPDMSGFECFKSIRLLEQHMSTPVCIFSTFANPYEVALLKKAGASYVPKPATIKELSRLLNEIFVKISGKAATADGVPA